jgi:hypothetical protein
MQPVKQPEAAPFLTGQFLISAEKVAAIKERDLRQVYDLKITTNLEEGSCKQTVLGRAQEEEEQQQQQQQQAVLGSVEHPPTAAAAAAAAAAAPRHREQQQQRLQRTLVGLSNARSSSKAFWISLQDELATAGAAAPAAAGAAAAGAAVASARLPKVMKGVLSLFDHDKDVGRFSSPSV